MMDEQTENEAADQIRAWALNRTLRLKIEHVNRTDPIDVVFQVRHRGAVEFESLGKCMTAPFVFEEPAGLEDVLQEDVDALPNPWKVEFATMLKTWSRLNGIVEFGSTHQARYGREPQSSVDCYELEDGGTSEAA
jgi:hypothetical protein